MTLKQLILAAPLLLLPGVAMGQGDGANPSEFLKPLRDSWPTYNGDYSGKRYSTLSQVNQTNVMHLTLAWMTRVTPGARNTGGGGGGGGRGGGGRGGRGGGGGGVIVGGEGPGDIAAGGG